MTNYNNAPFVQVKEFFPVWNGWGKICTELNKTIAELGDGNKVIVIETYQGVIHEELVSALQDGLEYDQWLNSNTSMKSEEAIKDMVQPDVTEDRIFGYLTRLNISDFYDQKKIDNTRNLLAISEGITIIYGTGASLIPNSWDLLVYADMARWEIQMRMRKHLVDNIGMKNRDTEDWMLLYKQGFFVD